MKAESGEEEFESEEGEELAMEEEEQANEEEEFKSVEEEEQTNEEEEFKSEEEEEHSNEEEEFKSEEEEEQANEEEQFKSEEEEEQANKGEEKPVKVDTMARPHEYLFLDEAGFNLQKRRQRGLNIIGQRAITEVPGQRGVILLFVRPWVWRGLSTGMLSLGLTTPNVSSPS
ncbi:hypothetical protein C0J45_21374 [Silurus meridionalis]|nr:hypothetical protein C0J45_21374 [Silurus meridionalis]